jgi:hypothetical protein
MFLEESLTQ